jgi:hypothetical protein
MNQIVPMIFDLIGSDDANDSADLVDYYNGATSAQREAMNEMCMFLCGWSLETVCERCGLRVDTKTGTVNV